MNRRNLVVWLLAWATSATAPAVLAGQRVQVEVGERVRITPVGGGSRATGTVTELGAERLQFREADGVVRSLTYDDIGRLERSLGRANHVGKGALIGGGIGFGVGAAFGVLLVHGLCESANGCGGDIPEAVIVVGGTFGLGGAALGALGGLAASGERWRAVPIGSSRVGLGLRIDPSDRWGLGLGVRIHP